MRLQPPLLLALLIAAAASAHAQVTPSVQQAATRKVEFGAYVQGGAVQLFDLSGNVIGTSNNPLVVNCNSGCAGGGGGSSSITSWGGGVLGPMANYGTSPGAVLVPGMNAYITNAPVLGAGSAIIGKIGIDQTTPGTTNAVQATNLPATVDTNTGAAGNSTLRAVLANNPTIQPVPGASAGTSVKSIQVANNTTSVAVDASPGQLYGIRAFNNSATIAYGKLYNAAQGSTTCGSGTPQDRFMIPANTSGAGFVVPIPYGEGFSTAITVCITGGFADSDTTAPAASTYEVSFDYK